MKISEIMNPVNNQNIQATISKITPGKEAEIMLPDGTKIVKNLATNPNALTQDPSGKIVTNLSNIDKNKQPIVNPKLTAGAKVNVNLLNKPTL